MGFDPVNIIRCRGNGPSWQSAGVVSGMGQAVVFGQA